MNCNNFRKYIRSYDEFGHTIELNFNKSGSMFQTLPGGVCSLILKFVMIAYLLNGLSDMVWRNADSFGTESTILSLDDFNDLEADMFNEEFGLLFYFRFYDNKEMFNPTGEWTDEILSHLYI